MFQKRILVIHPSSAEADRLARLANKFGPARAETGAEPVLAAFAEGDVAVAVIDAAFSRSTALRAMVRPPTGVLLTGDDEADVARAADEWPPGVDVDFCRTSPAEPREMAFLRLSRGPRFPSTWREHEALARRPRRRRNGGLVV